MKNKQILIIGGAVAVAIWGFASLWFIAVDEPELGSSRAKADSEIVGDVESATPAMEELNAEEEERVEVFEEPISGVPAGEMNEPVAGKVPEVQPLRKASVPAKAPRPALASFKDKGEICVDAETGNILYGNNITVKCPPASVTKLMTLYVVLDSVESGKLKLNDTAVCSLRAQRMGGTQVNLADGELCVVNDLVYALMVESANDAAVALAEKISGNVEDFVALMNKSAKELGMVNSSFETPHGLPPSRKEKLAGARLDMTTAEDLAKLSVALLKKFPQTFEYSSTKIRQFPVNTLRKEPLWMRNHNRLLSIFDGCDGLKTGWTNDGASIVTTASRGNRRVIAVVLGGLVRNKKGEIDAKTSQRERNQRAAELMFKGLKELDVLQYEPTAYKK